MVYYILFSCVSETTIVTLDLQTSSDDSTHASLSLLSSPLPCSSSSSLYSSGSSQVSSPCSLRAVSQSASGFNRWQETFEVPWEKMPQEVQSAIANAKRPAPDKRRQMIRILVDEIRKFDPNPPRNECLIICQNIVKEYPSSFADMTPGGVIICGGFTSLLTQVKTRIENINRAGTLKRLRSSRRSGPMPKSADSYGCTQFQPEPPPEENSETLEEKRQQLMNIYSQEGIQSGDRTEVISLMKTTYCLQRDQINQTPAASIENLRIQWPYLFIPRGLYHHFELLTGINVLRALESSIDECGKGIEKYLRIKAKSKVAQSVSSEGEDGELALRVIQLLMNYFSEKTEALILLADVSVL